MFCTHCGKELGEGAAFCSACGAPTGIWAEQPAQPQPAQPLAPQATPYYAPPQPSPKPALPANSFGIAGFIIAMASLFGAGIIPIVPIVGLVFSIIGMAKRKEYSLNGFALAGIIINAISFFVWLLVLIAYGFAFAYYWEQTIVFAAPLLF